MELPSIEEIDATQDADRAYFAAHPKRACYVRLARQSEIDVTPLHTENGVALPPHFVVLTIVYQLWRSADQPGGGVRTRVQYFGPPEFTRLDDAQALKLYRHACKGKQINGQPMWAAVKRFRDRLRREMG